MPADAVVEDGVAQGIVDAIVAQGKELEKVLLETGIVTGQPHTESWQVDAEQLVRHFDRHCVIMRGHLPRYYWPKYRRGSSDQRDVTLCTCREFARHAECEHQVFVLALCARPGDPPDLENAPTVRKTGRKRKAEANLTSEEKRGRQQ